MKIFVKILVCLTLCASVSICDSALFKVNAADSKDNAKNDVVAVVNGEKITRDQLAEFLIESFSQQGIEIIIKRTLLAQEAKKQNIIVSDKEVAERTNRIVDLEVEKIKSKYGEKNKEAFEMDMVKMGYDETKLRKKLAGRVEIDIWPQLLSEKLIKKTVTVTDEQLKQAYAEKYGEKVLLRQIVVKTPEEAEALLKQIRAGADFAALAKDRSLDRPSAAKGGLMNPISPVGPFGESIAKFKKGDITDVIKSRGGFHIFKVEGKTQPEEIKPFKDVLPELEEVVMAVNIKRRSGPWFLKLMESADIKNYIKE